MGFRTGAYATVWEVKPASDVRTQVRISTSRKDKQTGEYDTDFSSYVAFVGTATAQKAARLKPRDRIRIGDCEATTKYDKERDTKYYNYTVFTFDQVDSNFSGASDGSFNMNASENNRPPVSGFIYEGIPDDPDINEELPW